jgi:hypothetical protein
MTGYVFLTAVCIIFIMVMCFFGALWIYDKCDDSYDGQIAVLFTIIFEIVAFIILLGYVFGYSL